MYNTFLLFCSLSSICAAWKTNLPLPIFSYAGWCVKLNDFTQTVDNIKCHLTWGICCCLRLIMSYLHFPCLMFINWIYYQSFIFLLQQKNYISIIRHWNNLYSLLALGLQEWASVVCNLILQTHFVKKLLFVMCTKPYKKPHGLIAFILGNNNLKWWEEAKLSLFFCS